MAALGWLLNLGFAGGGDVAAGPGGAVTATDYYDIGRTGQSEYQPLAQEADVYVFDGEKDVKS